jgi:purine-binding chemotaxis protein CheW
MAQASVKPVDEDLVQALDDHGSQYLTFVLADEDYGVDILRVREIRGWDSVTRIPNAEPYVKGVLNLRGAIVPIYDLRQRFGLDVAEYSKETVVIVLLVRDKKGKERSVGVVVDGVSNVLNAAKSDVRATPEFGGNVSTEFIQGLVSAEKKMVMLLDVDKLMARNDDPGERERLEDDDTEEDEVA